jgi:uncharacterized protein (DUF2062 family)
MLCSAITVPKPPWWQRWIVLPVKKQLTQGITPEKLGWTIGAGLAAGIFPILGSTSILAFLVALVFRLNQPVIHIFSTMMYPVHLATILVFIRIGQKMHGVELIRFSIPELFARFTEDWLQFAKDFSLAAWHGITAWLIVTPFIVIGARLIATPILRRLKR